MVDISTNQYYIHAMKQTSDTKGGCIAARNASRQAFMTVMRELVRAYQAFTRFDAGLIRGYGLTQAQFDIIATLGNTEGMTFKQIGELTLITKGTLTGVVDRLERDGMVRRHAEAADQRSTRVRLTAKGERMFEQVFPRHIAALKVRFERLGAHEMLEAERVLKKLRSLF